MSSNSREGYRSAPGFGRAVAGAAFIVVQAAVIGLAANAVSPHRLSWIRVPLSETHRMASTHEVLAQPQISQVIVRPKARSSPLAPPSVESVIEAPAQRKLLPPVPERSAPRRAKPLSAPTPAAVHPTPQEIMPPAPKAAVAPAKVEALFTSLPDAKTLFDRKEAVFVDARHSEDYAVEHIPGAVSLFAEDFDAKYDSVFGAVPKDRPIVTYCSDPQCEMAVKLGDALVAHGHTKVFILLEGLPGWKGAGYPTSTGAAP